MRILFAFGAMLSKTWASGNIEQDAKRCFEIADAMVAAKSVVPETEEGIIGVIKKSRKSKEA